MCSSDPVRAFAVVDGIADCERRIAAIRAEQLALVDELDRELVATFPDAAREELVVACRISDAQARTRLATARALGGRLTLTRDALRAGRLSFEHAAAMASATAGLTVAESRWVEHEVLDDPRAVTAGQLAYRAREAVARMSPQDREPVRRPVPERSLTAYRDEVGTAFRIDLPTVDAEVLVSYLDATSAREGRDDVRPAAQRRADSLLDLVRAALDAGTLPSGGDGRRPHLELMTDLAALAGGPRCGAEVGGRFVVATELRELACDADVRVSVVDGPDRTLVDQGRTSRVVSARLRGRLDVRDRHCRFPGCAVRAPRCRAHHIRHWADGGPTDAANLVHRRCNHYGL